jgi:hypothetical protein
VVAQRTEHGVAELARVGGRTDQRNAVLAQEPLDGIRVDWVLDRTPAGEADDDEGATDDDARG